MAKISFIGGGVMAEAIISRVLSENLIAANNIRVGEPNEQRRLLLKEKYLVHTTNNNIEAVEDSDLIFLCVKPQDLENVLVGLTSIVNPTAAIVSIAAGIPIEYIKTHTGGHSRIVRVMPNTPAQIGEGMSIWTYTEMSQTQVDLTVNILRTIGLEIHVENEKLIDMSTALSGSGPAYVFLFIESLIDAGVKLGLPRNSARTMAIQTVVGSIGLLKETDQHPSVLKDSVTSPGGTTAAALLELEKGNFKATIVQAVVAAFEQSNSMMKDANQ